MIYLKLVITFYSWYNLKIINQKTRYMKKLIFFWAILLSFPVILKAQSGTPVPVSISSFDATSTNNFNKLFWKTACSLDYANFEIQRSYNGNDYTTINAFSADRFRCQQPFDFSDSNANQLSGRIFYRLKVGDIDGRIYNSKIVSVLTHGEGLEINSFTPTLVTGSASLSISSSVNDDAVISIVNVQGMIVSSQKIRLNKGVNNIQIKTAVLQSGKYWLKLVNSKTALKTVQFIKQ